jgi:hypothetical protein
MKEHLAGGTLRKVMVVEVLRSLKSHEGKVDPAAIELGVTPRTLRIWKHAWPELSAGGMEKLSKVTKVKKKRSKKRTKKA